MIILLIIVICIGLAEASKIKPSKAAASNETTSEQRRSAQAIDANIARIQRENERRQAQEAKHRQKVAQARQDIPFYEVQLERLYITADQLNHQYKTAVENLRIDAELNRITDGKAVKAKIIEQHIAARDNTMKKLIAIETRIHAMEAKKAKAEAILTD